MTWSNARSGDKRKHGGLKAPDGRTKFEWPAGRPDHLKYVGGQGRGWRAHMEAQGKEGRGFSESLFTMATYCSLPLQAHSMPAPWRLIPAGLSYSNRTWTPFMLCPIWPTTWGCPPRCHRTRRPPTVGMCQAGSCHAPFIIHRSSRHSLHTALSCPHCDIYIHIHVYICRCLGMLAPKIAEVPQPKRSHPSSCTRAEMRCS